MSFAKKVAEAPGAAEAAAEVAAEAAAELEAASEVMASGRVIPISREQEEQKTMVAADTALREVIDQRFHVLIKSAWAAMLHHPNTNGTTIWLTVYTGWGRGFEEGGKRAVKEMCAHAIHRRIPPSMDRGPVDS